MSVFFKPFARKAFLLTTFSVLSALSAVGQTTAEEKNESVVVQPGAPGQASKILPSSTRGVLPPISPKDTEFMQEMIMHHSQAVEMTALIAERTQNKDVRKLGAKISQSQADEMAFMKRWLEARGKETSMPGMEGMDSSGGSHDHSSHKLMPGMLTPKQMQALKNAKGAEFDRLFLKGMIQHHEGALVMVKELFETSGAGQDAELFNFASDVDSGQRAEIKIMQTLLGQKP